ncbi:hypothetical protein HNR74_004994 [Flammeovirga kamogawensis]|nr:hypothetical protein [Flammeovirga kamogawensis]
MDPLTASYSSWTPYPFAMNKVINGVDLDELEWVLRIYSDDLFSKFNKAMDDNDLLGMRTITNYGRTHHYPSDYGLENIGRNQSDFSVQLYKNSSAPEGVTVDYYHWKDNNPNTKSLVNSGNNYFAPTKNDELPFDALYLVDIKYGISFYGEKDFINDSEISVAGTGLFEYGKTMGQGYIKGFGFSQYVGTSYGGAFGGGLGADIVLSGTGSYVGDYFPNPYNFAGNGGSGGLDVDIAVFSFGVSKWTGYNDEGNTIWRGVNYTVGGGFGAKLTEMLDTKSTIIFPKTGYSISEKMWNTNSINSDNITPIINEK